MRNRAEILFLQTGFEENLDKGQGAAVAYGRFVAVDFTDDVVDLSPLTAARTCSTV
jgi:hypothetical protein